MPTPFSLLADGLLSFEPGFPQDFKGPFLAGSEVSYFAGDIGVIVLQELVAEDYTLSFYFFRLLKRATLTRLLPKGFHSFMLRRGEARWHHKPRLRLREGQFLLSGGKAGEWQIEPAQDRPVEVFQASFALDSTSDLGSAFPELESLFAPEGKAVTAGPFSATPEIRDVVHHLLYAAYEPYRLPFYFKAKVSEYLFVLLHRASFVRPEKPLRPTAWETEAVFRIRDYILSDILQHHSIPELARRFKMNPLRLKVFFKREFGTGPYAFLLDARLDKVKELMEGGSPMKEAAPKAGYQTTSFITAFKRRFGYPPGAIFRKRKE